MPCIPRRVANIIFILKMTGSGKRLLFLKLGYCRCRETLISPKDCFFIHKTYTELIYESRFVDIYRNGNGAISISTKPSTTKPASAISFMYPFLLLALPAGDKARFESFAGKAFTSVFLKINIVVRTSRRERIKRS